MKGPTLSNRGAGKDMTAVKLNVAAGEVKTD